MSRIVKLFSAVSRGASRLGLEDFAYGLRRVADGVSTRLAGILVKIRRPEQADFREDLVEEEARQKETRPKSPKIRGETKGK